MITLGVVDVFTKPIYRQIMGKTPKMKNEMLRAGRAYKKKNLVGLSLHGII